MKKDTWFERGMDELKQGHWFDGFQMLQGAIQRTIRFNNPEHTKIILTEAIPLLALGKQEKIACNLGFSLISNIRFKIQERVYADLIPVTLVTLRKENLGKCVQTICNQIMLEKAFQVSEFLSHLNDLIRNASYDMNVISDLYFCFAGLFCYKKDYVSCFKTLKSWYNESSSFSPKIRVYLTLAEINAYEIESCGEYLQSELKSIDPDDTETKQYFEITYRIFSAVKTKNHSEFHSTINDYSDLINSKKDGLLKGLCDGISEIFNDKSQSGILSLFKP